MNSILNPHSQVLKSGKRTTGGGLNGQHQPQSTGQRIIYNPLTNQIHRRPISVNK